VGSNAFVLFAHMKGRFMIEVFMLFTFGLCNYSLLDKMALIVKTVIKCTYFYLLETVGM
jgi:hypothetical protein